jgi:hypothetical protein
LARILLVCTSATIVELGKMVFLAFLYLLAYSNDDGGGGGWWIIDVAFLNWR